MVRTRPAEPADVPAITEIANALIASTTYEWTEQPYALEERIEWLAAKQAHGYPVLVAVEDGDHDGSGDGRPEVLGWASYGDFRDSERWPGYRFVVEHSIHVRPDAWGRGVGRTLLAALEATARDDGRRVMVGAIDASNERSIAFHRLLGYREVGRLPGIGEKFGQCLDLVLVQRSLDG